MSQPSRFDLSDPEQRQLTFARRDRKGRLREIHVAPPCMAQLLAVVRLEPETPEAETPMRRVERDYRSTLLLCLPPFPAAWWERLPWYWRRWKVARFLQAVSYPHLAVLINNLIALAQGVPVDVLEQMATAAPTQTPAEREQAINEIIATVAAEMHMPPQVVAELPARHLAQLVEQVGKKLEKEEEWRSLLAGAGFRR